MLSLLVFVVAPLVLVGFLGSFFVGFLGLVMLLVAMPAKIYRKEWEDVANIAFAASFSVLCVLFGFALNFCMEYMQSFSNGANWLCVSLLAWIGITGFLVLTEWPRRILVRARSYYKNR